MAVPRLRGTRKKGPSDRSSAGEPHRGLPLAADDGYNDRGCTGDDEARVRIRKKGLNPSSTLAASPPLSPLTASTFGTIVWRPPSPRSGQPSATAVFTSSDAVVTKPAICAATALYFLPSAQASVSSGPPAIAAIAVAVLTVPICRCRCHHLPLGRKEEEWGEKEEEEEEG